MIRLDFLAMSLNEYLRIPFGFSQDELDAESMTITLTFDMPCDAYGEEVYIRNDALEELQSKLLGHKEFLIQCPDAEYNVNTYFEMQPPGNPYVDNGRITQQVVISGAALVKNNNCHAVVGNNVKVYVYEDIEHREELLKIERTSAMQIGADNNIPLSSGSVVPEVQGISKVCTKTVSFLYTGKNIEKEFLKYAEGVPFDINKVYTYEVNYGGMVITVPIKILGVSSQDSTGVFVQYTLTMQIVGDAEVA